MVSDEFLQFQISCLDFPTLSGSPLGSSTRVTLPSDVQLNFVRCPLDFIPKYGACTQTLVEDREGPVLFCLADSSRDWGDSTVFCTFGTYLEGLRNVERMLPMWASTFECHVVSHDLNIHGTLDSVAQDLTFSHRPITQAVAEIIMPSIIADQPAVLKREGSASRQHIKYPWNQKIPPNLKDKKRDYDLLQEDGWSLKELGLLRKSNPDQCSFMAREGGTRSEIALAHKEMRMFLALTLAGVIQLEEAVLQHQDIIQTSSLRVSAWLDLSVITDPESQELHYFTSPRMTTNRHHVVYEDGLAVLKQKSLLDHLLQIGLDPDARCLPLIMKESFDPMRGAPAVGFLWGQGGGGGVIKLPPLLDTNIQWVCHMKSGFIHVDKLESGSLPDTLQSNIAGNNVRLHFW
ncbi:hypothetical protein EDD22DRAFT_849089 [Suillus occidentalis]|nr:hypothetical protein EDD22DRAFT_849089 [Suillus occidentalis]